MSTLPSTMRGWYLTAHGGPETLVWKTDIPVPTPGAGEVLLRIGASSVNNTDINTRIGWYSKSVTGATDGATLDDSADDGGWDGALDLPRIQGADMCGRIVACGSDVNSARLGARVLVRAMPTRNGKVWTYGSEADGGFADYAVVRSEDCVAIESDLPDTSLAVLPCAYCTALELIQTVGIKAGDRVLITGASGGVGLAAVQLCAALGAAPVAMTTADKAETLRSYGAVDTLNRGDAPAPESLDAVIDLVGGETWPSLITGLKRGGRYGTSGAIAGPIVPLDLRDLYLKDLTLVGSTLQKDSVLPDLVAMVEAGKLDPPIAAIYDLEDLHAAQAQFQSKGFVGKIAISVSGSN